MKTRTLLFLPLAFVWLCAQVPNGDMLCQQAETALFQHQVAKSKELWEQAVKVLPPGEERGKAEIQLAVLAWRYDRNPAEAVQRFEVAASELPAWKVALAKARWRREEGDLSGALQLCRTAMTQATKDEERTTVRKAMLRIAPLTFLPGAASLDPTDIAFLLDQAKAIPADHDLARAEWLERLDLAILAGRGGDVLEAWSALIPQNEGGVGQPLASHLQALLPRWHGPGSLEQTEEVDLVQALAGSRLHLEAAWIARRAKIVAPIAKDEAAYAAFLREAKHLTDSYYQQTVLGQGSRNAWKNDLEAAENRLISHLDWGSGSAPHLSQSGIEKEMRKRFGAYLLYGRTAGYWDIHYGHVVRDLAWTPSQYGHTLDRPSHLITLDFEVSNGCESWLWDGRAAHGGWANLDGIFQWASDSVVASKCWSVLTEDKTREGWQKEQARLDALDAARPWTAPMNDLKGLQRRLWQKGANLLFAKLRGQGLSGAHLKKAFFAECDRSMEESTILAHEGRHTLDRNSMWTRLRLTFRWSQGLEYRAKLSEVAFAPIPYFAFAGILTENVGDTTPHGKANARVLKGLGAWVDAHASAIPGYSNTRPGWLQLDLLSADQLREAARSLDPWATQ